MNGVVARRNNFNEPILKFLENAYAEFGRLTGRNYGLISQYKCDEADTCSFARLRADNVEAACDYCANNATRRSARSTSTSSSRSPRPR